MSESRQSFSTRRQFLQNTGKVSIAAGLTGLAVPRVHAADDNTINVALIGCGGRGTGAAANAMSVNNGPVKLVAMADVFDNRLNSSYNSLINRYGDSMDVPDDRKFVGFDAYKHAMDCLKPGDVAIFTTPLTFRWVHFGYAIEKGLNVFMEKPLTADGPTSRRMIDLARKSVDANLRVGVGLMSRHSRALQEAHKRIQDGEIGDIAVMRGYRMSGPGGSAFSQKWNGEGSELLWQIQRFHSFIWASGGCFNDFYIHHVDHCCWMKNAWPIKAHASGGRHYRGDSVDQNFDSYAVEYTFEDGAKMIMNGRCVPGAENKYNSFAHGTKGSAILSNSGDCGLPSRFFTGQKADPSTMTWESVVASDERKPHQNEWDDLIDAIRADQPFNEAEDGVMASVVSSLGRKAAHTAREITLEDMLNSEDEYAPGVDKWTMDSPAPIQADENGKYPIPLPGLVTDREY